MQRQSTRHGTTECLLSQEMGSCMNLSTAPSVEKYQSVTFPQEALTHSQRLRLLRLMRPAKHKQPFFWQSKGALEASTFGRWSFRGCPIQFIPS